jgi:hypothetical protein
VFLAEAGHNQKQMGSHLVFDEIFYFFFWDGSDVVQKNLFQKAKSN